MMMVCIRIPNSFDFGNQTSNEVTKWLTDWLISNLYRLEIASKLFTYDKRVQLKNWNEYEVLVKYAHAQPDFE